MGSPPRVLWTQRTRGGTCAGRLPRAGRELLLSQGWVEGEAAAAFIAAVSQPGESAPVFNLNGRSETMETGLGILQELQAGAAITASGGPFPFPPDLDDTPIRSHVAEYPEISVREGVETTYRAFRQLAADGRLTELPG